MPTEKSEKVAWLSQISLGNALTMLSGIIAVGMICGATLTRVQAIEAKMELNENSDRKSLETVGSVKEKVTEISAEQKSFRRDVDRISEQLTRIENMIRRPNPPNP